MIDDGDTALPAGHSNDGQVRWAFDTMKKCLALYGVVGVIVLATLAVVAVTQGEVSTFMWVRAAILLAVAPLFHRLAVRASRGLRKDFDRLRTVSLVAPIAIVAVDLIPGLCPAWYLVMQAVSAMTLVAVAVITRRRILNSVFARSA